jgi:hypothetical protein
MARHTAMTEQSFCYFQIGFARALRLQRMLNARAELDLELRAELVKQAQYWHSMMMRYLSDLESPSSGAG